MFFVLFCSHVHASPAISFMKPTPGIIPLNTPTSSVVQQAHKMNHLKSFIRGFIQKHFGLKKKDRNPSKTALTLGILALVCVLIPWYTILAAIPLGIAAIITGSNAEATNLKDRKKAKAGITLGIIALGLFALYLILGLILLVSMLALFSWNYQ